MDMSRRETSLLMGVGILVALVVIVWFGMTMAARQMLQRRAQWERVREQLVQAHRQTDRQPSPAARDDLDKAAQAAAQMFVTSSTTQVVKANLESLAAASGVTITPSASLAPAVPSQWIPGFQRCYEVIRVVATIEGRYRNLAACLKRVANSQIPVVVVRNCTVTPAGSADGGVLKARVVLETFVWRPRAVPKGPAAAPHEPPAEPRPEATEGTWGRDPFDPRYLATPGVEGVALNGIIRDSQHQTCVINGMVLGVGGVVNGYTIAAITPQAVLLRGDRELVLTVSP